MKLLFDLYSAQSAILGAEGAGEYSRVVFRHVAQLAGPDDLGVAYALDEPLDPDIEKLVARGGFQRHEGAEVADVEALAATGGYSRFMSGNPYRFHAVDFKDMEVFLAVHGMRPVECPVDSREIHYARRPGKALKWALKMLLPEVYRSRRRRQFQALMNVKARRRRFIVPSRHTMGTILDLLTGVGEDEILALDCPATPVCRITDPDMSILDRLELAPGGYLFMVSGNRWIKNSHRAIQAAVGAMEALPEAKRVAIVVTGGLPRGVPTRSGVRVITPGTVSLEDLAALYAGARFLFYPTLNEGYGYPPLEAWSHGTPVLSSAVCSLTELLGDGALYFDPRNILEMQNRISLVLEKPDLLDDYRQRGLERQAHVSARQKAHLDELGRLLLEG